MKTNIALIGMMGTYKSTCGKLLADKLELAFLDMDKLIEYEENMLISDMFDKHGEEYFRDVESKKIMRISDYENIVVATGGGVVKREENILNLKKCCHIVLLEATSQAIFSRIKNTQNRPLLKDMTLEKIEKLNVERKALYEKAADIIIDTTNLSPKNVVDEIENKIYQYIMENMKGGQKE